MRTSLYSILCIAIRLGAVLLAVSTLVLIPGTLRMVAMSEHSEGGGVFAVICIILLALAAGLWVYPGVLARTAAGPASQQVFESALSAAELQQIALSIAGVWFAMTGITELAGMSARFFVDMRSNGMSFSDVFAHELYRFAPIPFKIVLGIALTFGARGLVGWVRRLREHGLPVVRSDEEATPNFQDPPHPP